MALFGKGSAPARTLPALQAGPGTVAHEVLLGSCSRGPPSLCGSAQVQAALSPQAAVAAAECCEVCMSQQEASLVCLAVPNKHLLRNASLCSVTLSCCFQGPLVELP